MSFRTLFGGFLLMMIGVMLPSVAEQEIGARAGTLTLVEPVYEVPMWANMAMVAFVAAGIACMMIALVRCIGVSPATSSTSN